MFNLLGFERVFKGLEKLVLEIGGKGGFSSGNPHAPDLVQSLLILSLFSKTLHLTRNQKEDLESIAKDK